LLDFLAAAVRAENFPFFVVDEEQDLGEEFLAIVAEEFVMRHTNLLAEVVTTGILELPTVEHNLVRSTELPVPCALGRTISGIGRRTLCPNHGIALCAFSFVCSHY
jgi:hypothetical protein